MSKAPAFQFYPKDYESDENVKMMSLEQEGAFLRLMCHAWLHGSIPADVVALARICRVPPSKMARVWPGVSPCFVGGVTHGRLVNPRQERDRASQAKFLKERAESGRDGALKRWGANMAKPSNGHSSATDQPMAKHSSPFSVLQSPSPTTATDPVATAPAPAEPSADLFGDTATTPGEVTPSESVAIAKAHVLAEPLPWNREAAEIWWQEYKGSPPKQYFAALKPLVKRESWERVRPALVTYLAETPIEYLSLAKVFVGAFGTWEAKARGDPARASTKGSVGDRTLAAMERFIRRGGESDRAEGVLVGSEQVGDGGTSGDR